MRAEGNLDLCTYKNHEPVVLVTGGALRIGAGIAELFHGRGFNVLISFNKSNEAATMLIKKFNRIRPESAHSIKANLALSDEVSVLAQKALIWKGHIDVLINNASSFYPTPFELTKQEEWDELIGSNLRGAYFLVKALASSIKNRQGSIVNLVDTHSDRPLANHPVYSIAKAGLKAMTKSLAIELGPDVRANGVSPGAILWPPSLEDSEGPDVLRRREEMLLSIPMKELGNISDITETVYFLACQARYVTGQVIKVDGGRNLGLAN
jgi:pteridine reductase